MTDAIRRSEPLRFKAYYWLMSYALIGCGLGFGSHLASHALGLDLPPALAASKALNYTAYFLVWTGMLISPFLLVAKFMRDEYAEDLWKRTAVLMVYVLGTVPLAIVMFVYFAQIIIGGTSAPDWLAWLYEDDNLINFLRVTCLAVPFTFLAIFHILRLKDSLA